MRSRCTFRTTNTTKGGRQGPSPSAKAFRQPEWSILVRCCFHENTGPFVGACNAPEPDWMTLWRRRHRSLWVPHPEQDTKIWYKRYTQATVSFPSTSRYIVLRWSENDSWSILRTRHFLFRLGLLHMFHAWPDRLGELCSCSNVGTW